ncbi:alpha/beta hydrolase [Aquihabitans sp. G128]|uniref:alpha/beta fold hydrolase n=1 Tax=Aquihabitans sp. G128 TaxID=2849779 RepID=UPI001C219D06|nr:alpha/beta hydrolase [Aquihabitans sp. G128]QXC61113.1 alpha/beta hydrolase [Aquihabitans sp. G128]
MLGRCGSNFEGSDGLALVGDAEGPEGGPPVLLLHGGGQTRHSWSGTLTTLANQGRHAISLDLRGHGDSQWAPDGNYSLEAFAADVAAVAASFDRPPALVGASLGGLASLVAIAESDDQAAVASSLTLVDVAHRLEEGGRDRIGAFMTGNLDGFASLEDAADVVAAYNPTRPRPRDLSGLRKNLRQRDDGRWVWHWDPAFIRGSFGSPDETRTTMVEPGRLRSAAEALQVPTLLVRGRSSDLLSAEGAQEFLSIVPQAEFADVAGAGHMVAGDRNEIFNRAILDFLARH